MTMKTYNLRCIAKIIATPSYEQKSRVEIYAFINSQFNKISTNVDGKYKMHQELMNML